MIFMGQPMPDETIQSIKIDHETIGHILTDPKDSASSRKPTIIRLEKGACKTIVS